MTTRKRKRKRKTSKLTKLKRKMRRNSKKIITYICVILTGWATPSAFVHHEIISYLIYGAF